MPFRNAPENLGRWIGVVLRPPRRRLPPPSRAAITLGIVAFAATIDCMIVLDTAASGWARGLPRWLESVFEVITDFGLSGWFLIPSAAIVFVLAAAMSPKLTRITQSALAALAVRFGFLFFAVGVPGLFVAIAKRLIGRARPYVDQPDDPFTYMPFVWRPEFASMPSGHATTAAAAAIAIGAMWPQSRAVMWLYALLIMVSRVVVLAHHPSDVVAGALVGTVGAWWVRRHFAARGLLFGPSDLQAFPGPSWRRVKAALGAAWRLRGTGQKA
jgi:membrane-associated phospholipid phosphatase